MKIADLRLTGLAGATVEGGWAAELEPQDNLHTVVEVVADDGRVGIGSAMTSLALVEGGAKLLRPFLIGERADEPARVSEKLRQHTFWQGRGGAVEHAISGIDIALWDLMGKACSQPVSRLLGGNYRRTIKPYGSILFDEPEPLSRTLASVVERGFRAIKLGWRPFGRHSSEFDELLVRTARRTVGDDVELMVDAGGSEQFWPHGTNWARRTASMLADFGIVWFEEPLPPDDLAGYIELTRASPVPIAGGEVLTRRQAFRPWIEGRAVDILQPDCTKNGGLTESRRIAVLAYDHNVQVVPHGWNTAVGLAADLQFSSAIPVARYVEYLTPSAYIDEILTEPFRLDDRGRLAIPTGPGLGIEIDPEKLKRFCPERVTFR